MCSRFSFPPCAMLSTQSPRPHDEAVDSSTVSGSRKLSLECVHCVRCALCVCATRRRWISEASLLRRAACARAHRAAVLGFTPVDCCAHDVANELLTRNPDIADSTDLLEFASGTAGNRASSSVRRPGPLFQACEGMRSLVNIDEQVSVKRAGGRLCRSRMRFCALEFGFTLSSTHRCPAHVSRRRSRLLQTGRARAWTSVSM
jgi:hypothetical protein